jgi:protein involved in polysaccharide export with SLBB domain
MLSQIDALPSRVGALLACLTLTALAPQAGGQAPASADAPPAKAAAPAPAPARITVGQAIEIRAINVLPREPIDGIYTVDPAGKVVLGWSYGRMPVAGLTYEEAEQAITKRLKEAENLKLANAQVFVTPPGLVRLHSHDRRLGLEQRLDQMEAQLREIRAALDALRSAQRAGKQ